MSFEGQSNQRFNTVIQESQINKTAEMKLGEPKEELLQSTREYSVSSSLIELSESGNRAIFEKPITPDSKVCLIGDGQGSDTAFMAFNLGVNPENIVSVNYDQNEVEKANKKFKELENKEKYKKLNLKGQLKMVSGDATVFEDFKKNNIEENSQEIITLLHVLETPDIRDGAEKNLIKNINKILKENGELLASQYKQRLTPEQAKKIGVKQIKAETLQQKFGDNWPEEFKNKYGINWKESMRYSEISNIRTKDELMNLFKDNFDIKLSENDFEYILKMKKKIKK